MLFIRYVKPGAVVKTPIMEPMQRRRVTLQIKTWADTFPTVKTIVRDGDASALPVIKCEGADYLEEQFRLAEARNHEFHYALALTQEAM